MFKNEKTISISTANGNVELTIYGENSEAETVFDVPESEAIANGEATIQIQEGFSYEYKISKGFCLKNPSVIFSSKTNPSTGRIMPNIYVGTLTLSVFDINKNENCAEVQLEVRSVKTEYREDYRNMLEDITEACTDLLLEQNSPVSQFFEIDPELDAVTLYQRFAFIKSIVDSTEFGDSVHKVLSAPVTRWKESEIEKDIRKASRINNKVLKQITWASQRIGLPDNHPFKSIVRSIPAKIKTSHKTETVDTSENRFIKHALNYFLSFCGDIKAKAKQSSRLEQEASLLESKLEQFLSHSVFKEVLLPDTLLLNSPVLQRKEGYREVLKVWLMFDLAAKLIWHGGEDVYNAGKRDVAVLYEYWLFFKLLGLLKDVFKIDSSSVEDLIEKTKNGLGLKLKQGRYLPVKGVYLAGSRKLNIEFSYNKTFSGEKVYPAGGSWTKSMRPDYTLSIWPFGIEQEQAETEEIIVHIHFDAKYKVENLKTIFGDGENENLSEEKEEQKKGTYKRADFLKMHAYRDAIRRTGGAYVLYPGSESGTQQGFHELLPGLGAFAIRPSKENDGTKELKSFLHEIVDHFLNRASQREKIALKTYETYKSNSVEDVKIALPEAYGVNRNLLPDETFVLVAFYKSEEHLEWIKKNKLYNARTGTGNGSLPVSSKTTGAKYLLLHGPGKHTTQILFRLSDAGPRIFTKEDLKRKAYPEPSKDFYLVFEIRNNAEIEFENMNWDVTTLQGYKSGNAKAYPFSVSLTELLLSVK